MAEVVGIRFKEVGKVYYFDPDGKTFEKGDRAIVETARGVECGEVTMGNSVVDDSEIVKPLKSVIRAATKADLERVRENAEKEKKAFSVCEEKILKHKLDMKLVNVEYTFDGGKILFYFTADGRVGFQRACKGPCVRVQDENRTKADRRERRSQNARRLRHLRQTVLLQDLSRRLSACFYKNGKGAGLVAESSKNKRHLRQTDVLS